MARVKIWRRFLRECVVLSWYRVGFFLHCTETDGADG